MEVKFLNIFVNDVKNKKEFTNCDTVILTVYTKKILKKNPELQRKLRNKLKQCKEQQKPASIIYKEIRKSHEYKLLLKAVRQYFRTIYGIFQIDIDSREKILNRIIKKPSVEAHVAMLNTHRSTKERSSYYKEIYKTIFQKTKKPLSILDLGAGLNVFSYPFLDCKPRYYAYELNEKDSILVTRYMKAMNIPGKIKTIDLADSDSVLNEQFPKTDVCFMFKLVNTLETIKRHSSKTLISAIKSRYIVVSFSEKSIGGRKNIGTRFWFENYTKKHFLVDKFTIGNETFYILQHNNTKL